MDRKRLKRFLDIVKKVLVALGFTAQLLLALLQLLDKLF